MIPLTVAPFATGSGAPILDAVLAGTVLLHSHIGFDACVTDYFSPRKWPRLAVIMRWLLRGATVTAGVGLFSYQTNDVGLTEGIKRVWKS